MGRYCPKEGENREKVYFSLLTPHQMIYPLCNNTIYTTLNPIGDYEKNEEVRERERKEREKKIEQEQKRRKYRIFAEHKFYKLLRQ